MAGASSLLKTLFLLSSLQVVISQCNIFCHQGEYCYQDTCHQCKPGTYQREILHQLVYCLPWTQYDVESHFIIVQNGTSVSDIVWRCKEGYQKHEFTVGGYECITIVTTDSTTPTSVASSTESSAEVLTTVSSPATTNDEGNSITLIIALGVTIPVIAIIIIIIICCVCRFLKRRRKHNHIHCYKAYFTKFVDKLSIELTIQFISILDPEDDQINRATPMHPNHSELVDRLATWAESKKGVSKTVLEVALDRVHRPYLFRELIPEWLRLQRAGLTRDDDVELGNQVVFKEMSKHPDRYQLFHFLFNFLDPNNKELLLRVLPDTTFNASDFYKERKVSGSVGFADVMEEFYQRNKEVSFKQILTDFLRDNNRKDILGNETFWELLKLVDASCPEGQDVREGGVLLSHLETVDEISSHQADSQEVEDSQYAALLPHSDTDTQPSIKHVDSQEFDGLSDAELSPHSDTVDQVCDSEASHEMSGLENALLPGSKNVDHTIKFTSGRHRNGALEESHLWSS